MEFRVSRFYQFKPQSRRRLRPKLGTEVHPCGAFHRRRRLRRSNMTFFARSRSLRVLRPRRRFGSGWGRRRRTKDSRRFMARNSFPCQGFGALQCEGPRENRTKDGDCDTDRENSECQTFILSPKSWRTPFSFLAGGRCTDGQRRRLTCTPLVAVLDFPQN